MPTMHRHLRPFFAAVALVLLASAAWWLLLPTELPSANQAPSDGHDPPGGAGARASAAAPRASAFPRVGREDLADAPPESEPTLALPGTLPGLDAAIAQALPDPEPPIEELLTQGQLHPSAGREAARAAWPAVQRCAGEWRGPLRLEFGVAGGEIVGSSRFWEPKASGSTPEIAACIARELADVRAAAATDANGTVQVVYRLGPAQSKDN